MIGRVFLQLSGVFLFVVSVLFFSTVTLYGQAVEDITITQRIGENTDPPTVPDPVFAIPVSTDQINVNWGASFDPFGVAGYILSRNGVSIATTTSLSFADTGLQASTTYTYRVQAFDIDGLISSSSVEVATTTFSIQQRIVEQRGRAPMPLLYDFSIVTGTTNVRIDFEANTNVRYIIRYGRDSSYDDGVLHAVQFDSEHTVIIPDLEGFTRYFYEVRLVDIYGQEALVREGSFVTEPYFSLDTGRNVSNLQVSILHNDVLLSWSNPWHEAFAYVTVVRNHHFFPRHPEDGFIVYRGTGEQFLDSTALSQYDRQFYTVFTHDINGFVSSGAITVAHKVPVSRQSFSLLPELHKPIIITPDTSVGELVESDEDIDVALEPIRTEGSEYLRLRFTDIYFSQGGVRLRAPVDTISLRQGIPILVQVPFEVVPAHLKVMIVSLATNESRMGTEHYLLRLNEDGTYYEAVIGSVHATGEFPMSVSVYDIENTRTNIIYGFVDFKAEINEEVSRQMNVYALLMAVVLFLTGVLLLLLVWRRRSDEDN